MQKSTNTKASFASKLRLSFTFFALHSLVHSLVHSLRAPSELWAGGLQLFKAKEYGTRRLRRLASN